MDNVTTTADVKRTAPDIALVGCGTWGKNLLRCLGGRVGIVCDHDEGARAYAYTGRTSLLVTDDLADVLGSPWIKAVVIATPPDTHFRLARAALSHGKHVFVEKPMAMTVVEGEALVDLAKGRRLVLMVGHLMRYHPAFNVLQGLVKSGELGKLRYLYAVRGKLGGLRREPDVLWSFAPHDISMILALVGKMPFKVQAMGGAYLTPGVPDVTAVDLDFGEVQANLFVNWLHPVKEQRLVVVCEKGIVVFRDGVSPAETLVVYPYKVDGREPVPGTSYMLPADRIEPLSLEMIEFQECIDSGRRPMTDGVEGLRVLQVLQDAQLSMKVGRPVMAAASRAPDWDEELVHEMDELQESPEVPGFWPGACDEVKLNTGWMSYPAELCPICQDKTPYTVHPLAEVETDDIGAGTTIWRWSHVMPGAKIGKNCMIGQGCFIGRNVVIGDGCRIQNGAQLFEGVELQDGVFIGPGVVFTNDHWPRVGAEYRLQGTSVQYGASIGANATILCGITIGAEAMVGAGSVVTKCVMSCETVAGNPARVL